MAISAIRCNLFPLQLQMSSSSSSAAPPSTLATQPQTAPTDPPPPRTLNKQQTNLAVNALFSYLASASSVSSSASHADEDSKRQLFDDDSFISLQFALKRTPDKTKTKPIRISIPHSIYGREGSEVCLLTKDPQKTFEDQLAEERVENITKVISISKLRSDYKQHQHKRELVGSYDLFLADSRIIPLLPPLLGKAFFLKKKQPAPVNLNRSNIAHELCSARDSTYVFLSGPSVLVKIARTSFSRQHVVDNILAAVPLIVEKIPRRWKNVQGIFLKTSSSAALPLYNSLPSMGKEVVAKSTALPSVASEDTHADQEDETKEAPKGIPRSARSKQSESSDVLVASQSPKLPKNSRKKAVSSPQSSSADGSQDSDQATTSSNGPLSAKRRSAKRSLTPVSPSTSSASSSTVTSKLVRPSPQKKSKKSSPVTPSSPRANSNLNSTNKNKKAPISSLKLGKVSHKH